MIALLIQQARPHQTVHQLALILVASGFCAASTPRTVGAIGVAMLATVCLMLAGDLRHRHDDRRAGRRRLVHVVGARTTGVALVVGLAVVALVGFVVGGLACGALVLATFGSTALYNGAKARRRPVVAAIGRALAGATLVGVYGAWFGAPAGFVWLAIASGVLDLGGNLAGDVRDLAADRRAGLRTVPIVLGTPTTAALTAGCGLAACGIATPMAQQVGPLIVAAIVGVAAAWMTVTVPARWAHAAAHGPKLMQWLLIGAAAIAVEPLNLGVGLMVIGGLWVMAMRAYVGTVPIAPPA